MKLTQQSVLEALKSVKAPAARVDIVSANQIKHLEVQEKSVHLDVEIADLSSTMEKSLKYQIEKAIQSIDESAQMEIHFQKKTEETPLSKIGTIIAVGAGKGGVGKSSVATNLAAVFHSKGYRVGLLDCDIYGPSIPIMMGVEGQKPMMLNGKVQPIEAHGIKMMSAGFFVEADQGIIWRGPMIHKLIQQFFKDVDWGPLDVMIIDLPPGTGDAPLSLTQTLPLTGAVMVSMPPKVSLADVRKSVAMFHQVKVPILGVIENMSHYVCAHCDEVDEIFDRGKVKEFCKSSNLTYLGDLPIDKRLRKQSDDGKPFYFDNAATPTGKALKEIADRLEPFIVPAEDARGDDVKIVL